MFILMHDNSGQLTLSWAAQSLWAFARRPSICTRPEGMPSGTDMCLFILF